MSGAVSKESFSRFPVHQCSFFDQYRGFDNSQRWLFVVKLRLRKIEFNRLESTIPTVRSDLHRERDRRLIAPITKAPYQRVALAPKRYESLDPTRSIGSRRIWQNAAARFGN